MEQKNSPIEIQNVKQWNENLRGSTAAGMTPCKAIAPRFSQLASQNPHIRFLRVDVDQQKAIAAKYQVTAMPTFIAIKAGKPVDMVDTGADPQGLAHLVFQHGGPNPPVPPLPEEAEAAKVSGNAFYKDGHYAEAIEQYTAAISAAPNSGALYGNRSIAYLKLTPPNLDLALADAEKATEVEPKWGKGYARLGEALQALEKDEEAVKAFEKAKKLEAVKKRLGWH
ncbi:thioredoxin-domain-containing protein [Mycena leptocephala]|nr:thioredoxin-domain-containing protein [Mycena leptocephala]